MQGQLLDGTFIAVKQLSSKSRQGNREFINEIGLISCVQHPNLVKLHGYCAEGEQLLLVYEYLENNGLARVLFGASLLVHEFLHFSCVKWSYEKLKKNKSDISGFNLNVFFVNFLKQLDKMKIVFYPIFNNYFPIIALKWIALV